MKMIVIWMDSSNITASKDQLAEELPKFNGAPIRVRITKSQPRLTAEKKEAKTQEKADKKAATAKAKEDKAAAKAQKAIDKAAKKAEKKSEKEAAKNIIEKTEAAAQKAIDSKPAKKSHHNPAKGY